MATEKVEAAASDTKEIGEAGSDDVEHQACYPTPPAAGSTFEVHLLQFKLAPIDEAD